MSWDSSKTEELLVRREAECGCMNASAGTHPTVRKIVTNKPKSLMWKDHHYVETSGWNDLVLKVMENSVGTGRGNLTTEYTEYTERGMVECKVQNHFGECPHWIICGLRIFRIEISQSLLAGYVTERP